MSKVEGKVMLQAYKSAGINMIASLLQAYKSAGINMIASYF
jgi:hypothetical protein